MSSLLASPVSISQIATELQMSDETAYRLVRRGVVSGAKQNPFTGRWNLPHDAVDQIKAAFQPQAV